MEKRLGCLPLVTVLVLLVLRKEFMSKGEWRKANAKAGATSVRILVNHTRWLEANGYKRQAASCKRQASSLTRLNYNVIGEYRRKK